MCEVYRYFSRDYIQIADYSDESMLELFLSESYGDVHCKPTNGFYIGKRWLNVTVAMWKEDMDNGTLFKKELYDDPNIPNWWLDKIFKQKRK